MHKWLWGALDFAPRNPSEVEAADPSLVTNGLAVLLPAQQTRCLSPQTGSPWHPPCLYPGGSGLSLLPLSFIIWKTGSPGSLPV